jgi:hypothetical protein
MVRVTGIGVTLVTGRTSGTVLQGGVDLSR